MANTHEVPAMDYAEHNKTYSLFIGLIKWGTVFSVGLTLFIGAATGLIPWLFFLIVTAALTGAVVKFF
ncbi:MAG: aa3-type cytochrome c oxidase subunit IV [Proteobacteria bacterium]|nr:aa3-type cytochrome c oxidase subunit IV [Pseudomonadota bacterium]